MCQAITQLREHVPTLTKVFPSAVTLESLLALSVGKQLNNVSPPRGGQEEAKAWRLTYWKQLFTSFILCLNAHGMTKGRIDWGQMDMDPMEQTPVLETPSILYCWHYVHLIQSRLVPFCAQQETVSVPFVKSISVFMLPKHLFYRPRGCL